MDQAELFGRVIKCNQAKPQKDVNEGLGSRVAVWEQVRDFSAIRPLGCRLALVGSAANSLQEGYATRYNVNEETEGNADAADEKPEDPMQGLEGLDVAGPRLR